MNYRNAFWGALIVSLALLLTLVWMWRRPGRSGGRSEDIASTSHASEGTSVTAANPASVSGGTSLADESPLVPVQLTPERMQSIGVKFGNVEYKTVSNEIRVTGNVEIDETRVSYVQTRFPGWIRNVYANATYQLIRKGQPLFTIYSPDLVTTEQEYLLARKSQQQLANSSVSGVASGAESLVGAARERLQQWEIPPGEIEKLERTGKAISEITFNSPFAGFITEKNAIPNLYVQPETKLYTIADLSTVWVYANVFQTDLGSLKPGDAAQVSVDTYPGKVFSGRVDQILPQVDMNTRTARVRLIFANPGLKLSPGMYVNVVLKTPLGRQLMVPSSALFQSGSRQIVFVNRGSGCLDPIEVQVGARVSDGTIVTRGLKVGESVVTSANFLIDSESQLQAAAGSFVPPPPGAGQAAAVNTPSASAQANLELSSEPSPAHKGGNLFRVKLTEANGAPVAGAQVTVTFYMPAMPAMGMAAMKTTVTLADQGGGVYEGKQNLDSDGSWQVTLTALQGGKIIGARHLTVDAEGGM